MDIVLIITVIASLFLIIGAAEPLADRLRLPFSVILALLGILIASGATFFLQTEMTDALNPAAEAILGLPIRSNVFLYVFLPTLLFQATLGMNLQRMLDDWVPILVLAVVAVVVATLGVGYALSWASTLPIAACLLVGAIVSTTDPSAVVSIFRSISAPRRLARIIEGESLLNDAAAIALFGLFMGFVMLGIPDPTLGSALSRFPVLILGGALTGWLFARAGVWVMALFNRHELAQLTISVALPYLTYIATEQAVGASGVVAVVAAGLTLNLTAPGRLPPEAWSNLKDLWDVLAHWAGAMIFILAAPADSETAAGGAADRPRPRRCRRRRGHRGAGGDPLRPVAAAGALQALSGGRTALSRGDPLGWPTRGRHAGACAGGDGKRPGARGHPARRRHPRDGLHALHPAGAGHHAALGDRAPRPRPPCPRSTRRCRGRSSPSLFRRCVKMSPQPPRITS